MNRPARMAFVVVLGLVGLTAFGLSRVHSLQRLGQPGVKVLGQQVFGEGSQLIGTNSIALPETILNFESKAEPIAKVVSGWLPKDTTFAQRVYRAPDGFATLVNVVLMGSDRTSIHKPEYCLQGQGFRTEKIERLTIPIREPHPYSLPVQKWTVSREIQTGNGARGRHSAIYVFWFVADQQLTADHNERMKWMARDLLLRGVLQRWAYVACYSVCLPGQEDATYARMQEWIAAAVPRFQLATGPVTDLARNP